MMNSKPHGFSLMSLLITVAIIGILAAIAYPNYQRYVQRAHRAQAESCLMEYGQYLERYRSTNLRYDQDSGGSSNTLPALGCSTSDNLDDFYTIGWALTSTTYTITATAKGTQTSDECGNLTYTNTGVKGASGGDVESCW